MTNEPDRVTDAEPRVTPAAAGADQARAEAPSVTTPSVSPPVVRAAGERWAADTGSPVLALRDAVRWGPIIAGLVTAITTFLLLSLLGLGIGISAVGNPQDQGGLMASLSAIVGALVGLVAFFLGGFVAGRTAAVVGRPAGALNGFLVWALGVVLILLLGAFGLSSVLGAAGQIFGQIGMPNVQPPNVTPGQAVDAVRNSALVAFVSLALPAVAAALGGALGAAGGVEEKVVD